MSTINKKPTSNHLALLLSIKKKIEQHQIEVKTIKKTHTHRNKHNIDTDKTIESK